MKVFLADEQEIFRDGLRCLFTNETAFQVVGEAASVDALLAALPRSHPDMILLDLDLPGGAGLSAIERVRTAAPSSRIIVMTLSEGFDFASRVIDAGASGCFSKRASFADLSEAMLKLVETNTTVTVSVPVARNDIGLETPPRPVDVAVPLSATTSAM